ncbi:GMC oxidoreductase [Frondihabitans australicus]|uniref:Choline dehydrogenase-like flavoprotein n=1 Tax=Frondihabitans australicus TaxID=386892 RepID=A0A495IGR2_9MICO|nr:GMC family oxidoreductase [Frondihabitans australicus]RKR75154.1 choline dehydrogenase-like flavoprotein [Frondihabitans australicus]
MTAVESFLDEHRDRLSALIDEVVPRDDYPSGTEAGGLEYLGRMLAERPDWLDDVRDVIDSGDASEHWDWFAELVAGGYYADPANGGNADAASWRMVDWSPEPPAGWGVAVPVDEAPRRVVHPRDLEGRYDAIVIGSGAGGGTAAAGLAESGRRVLVVEAGAWPSIAELSHDHLRNPRSDWGVAPLSGPPNEGNPRVSESLDGRTRLPIRPSEGAWGNNAFTAGGGTRVYGAQAWRFGELDFRMASTYGVPEGSALSDWPISYADLEPFYERAEWEVGVSGSRAEGPFDGHRETPLPMPELPAGPARDRLAKAATALGFTTLHVPLLVNSTEYLGRHACRQCRLCIGFACPVDAKNGSQNTMLTRAFATGNASIVLETRASRIRTDHSGRVIGVTLVGAEGDGVWTRDIDASEVVVSAGATESARLLLNSRSAREPNGLGNNADQVGRHLQGHLYGGAVGLFDDIVEDLIGPGPSIATTDYRHRNGDIVGGGIIVNEFVPTPSNTYRYLSGPGFIPRAGLDSKKGMREYARRFMRIMGPIQEMTNAESRVRIDASTVDRYGVPVAKLSGAVHHEDLRARDFTSTKSAEWLRAAGATAVVEFGGDRPGPSVGQHQAGTLRMGADPATSVVDPFGRVWGHDNLRVMDGSVHVTNGGVNPVLTIFATSIRSVDEMVGGWAAPARTSTGAAPAHAG